MDCSSQLARTCAATRATALRATRTTASRATRATASRAPLAFGLLVTLALTAALFFAAVSPAAATPRAPSQLTPWTFMIYLDGDNDLDPWGQYTIDLMTQGLAAGGHGNVAIPVLYDHYGDGGAEQGIVTAAGFVKLADVPEPDMSSGDTLAAFMEWAMEGWPAERYVLDVWDHGSGWQYLCSDSTTRADGSDDPLHGRMMVDDLAAGIRAGERAAGCPVDVILFEACNMAMVEVSWELRGLCDVMVGTELTQDWQGIPWERTMATLDADPAMSTMDLGKAMVDDLVWSYHVQNKDAKAISTLTAIDMTGQVELVTALDGLALILSSNMKLWRGAVGSAGSAAKNQIWCGGVGGVYWFADVYKFADELQKQIADDAVDAWCARVKAAVTGGLYTATSKNLVGKCYGINVAFPPNLSAYNLACWPIFDYDGCGLDFTTDTAWDEMLLAYYAAGSKKR
jgi:hypothetical protein